MKEEESTQPGTEDLWDIIKHIDSIREGRTNFFLVAEAMMITAYTALGSADGFLRTTVAVLGMVYTTSWFLVNLRQSNRIDFAARMLLPRRPIMLEILKAGKGISGKLVLNYIVPLVTLIFWLILLCFALGGCGRKISDVVPLAADVTAVEASLFNRPDSGPDIAAFSVLPQDHGKVLPLFTGARIDSSPAKWQVLGMVSIARSNGSTCMVDLYWTGGGSGAFSVGSTYYRGSNDKEIIAVLTGCHMAAQAKDGLVEQPPSAGSLKASPED